VQIISNIESLMVLAHWKQCFQMGASYPWKWLFALANVFTLCSCH